MFYVVARVFCVARVLLGCSLRLLVLLGCFVWLLSCSVWLGCC